MLSQQQVQIKEVIKIVEKRLTSKILTFITGYF